MKYQLTLYLLLFFSFYTSIQAQDSSIVEVTGMVLTRNDKGVIEYVPFVTVAEESSGQGTYANYRGVYSIVVKKGSKLKFTAVGFKDRTIEISNDIPGAYKNMSVELEMAPVTLSEITVFPWPDRDNLAAEFLAMEPSYGAALDARARKNLDRNNLIAMTNSSTKSAGELSRYYLQQQSKSFSYQGQLAPQPIFDPLAWGKFFKQWSKKSKKKESPKVSFD